MQHGAQNLLHCVILQTDTHALCEDIFSKIRFNKILGVTYREDPLWVAFGPHVGVMDLLQDHPRLVMFPILDEKNKKHKCTC